MDFGNGDNHPPASYHERKRGLAPRLNDSNREKINDLEDRIEFLQQDIERAKAPAKRANLNKQIKKLQDALAKLR